MSFLRTVSDEQATGETAELYAADVASSGYVANYTRTFAARPPVYAAWQALNGAVKAGMSLRDYEVATVAAARAIGSSYCTIAHGQVLADEIGEDQVRALAGAGPAALADPRDAAIAAYAEQVATAPSSVGAADVQALRDAGLSDTDVLDVVLAAAARCFFATVLEATGTLPDAQYRQSVPDDLRDALTVGRPVAEG